MLGEVFGLPSGQALVQRLLHLRKIVGVQHLRQLLQREGARFLAHPQDDRPAAAEKDIGPAHVPVPDEDVGGLQRQIQPLLRLLDLLEQALVFLAEAKRLDQGPVGGQVEREEHRGEHQDQEPGGSIEFAALGEQQADQGREDRHDQAGEGLGAGGERGRQAHRDAAYEERNEDLVELSLRRIEQHDRQPPDGAHGRAGQAEIALPALRAFRPRPAHVVNAVEEDTHQARDHQPDEPRGEQVVADVTQKCSAGADRHEEDGGNVLTREPVQQRYPLRQELGGGE